MTRSGSTEHRVRVGRRPLYAFQRVQHTVRLETAHLVLEMALSAVPSKRTRDALRQKLAEHLDTDAQR